MIIHHPNGLHIGIDDGAADKPESAPLQVFRERVALRRVGRDLTEALPAVDEGAAPDKLPDIGIERADLSVAPRETPARS